MNIHFEHPPEHPPLKKHHFYSFFVDLPNFLQTSFEDRYDTIPMPFK